MNYDPLLITCFEGLLEDKHPYNFLAFAAIKDMLDAQVAFLKIYKRSNKKQ